MNALDSPHNRGSRGIGATIANAFRDQGADVIMTDIDTETGQNLPDLTIAELTIDGGLLPGSAATPSA